MNAEQKQAIVEIKSAVKRIDKEPWLAVALLASALRRFGEADALRAVAEALNG